MQRKASPTRRNDAAYLWCWFRHYLFVLGKHGFSFDALEPSSYVPCVTRTNCCQQEDDGADAVPKTVMLVTTGPPRSSMGWAEVCRGWPRSAAALASASPVGAAGADYAGWCAHLSFLAPIFRGRRSRSIALRPDRAHSELIGALRDGVDHERDTGTHRWWAMARAG